MAAMEPGFLDTSLLHDREAIMQQAVLAAEALNDASEHYWKSLRELTDDELIIFAEHARQHGGGPVFVDDLAAVVAGRYYPQQEYSRALTAATDYLRGRTFTDQDTDTLLTVQGLLDEMGIAIAAKEKSMRFRAR